jgi:hypothetical protein
MLPLSTFGRIFVNSAQQIDNKIISWRSKKSSNVKNVRTPANLYAEIASAKNIRTTMVPWNAIGKISLAKRNRDIKKRHVPGLPLRRLPKQ